MAIKITKDCAVSVVNPVNGNMFTAYEIVKELGDTTNELVIYNIGPFVLCNIAHDNEDNDIATMFLRYDIKGNVLIMTGHEIYDDKYRTPDNMMNSIEDSNGAVIKSINDTLVIHSRIQQRGVLDQYINMNIMSTDKKIILYDYENINNKIKEEGMTSDTIANFFNPVYDIIKNYKNVSSLKNRVLYEDDVCVVKFPKDIEKIVNTLGMMIEFYKNSESYEKCALIKNIIEKKSVRRKKSDTTN
jgi:hypothetical protein